MPRSRPSSARSASDRPPLDAPALDRLALAYVGRYATSGAGLARYLRRKLAERGWAGPDAPDAAAIVARFTALGYVDDRAMAEARGRTLARRGYGARRVAGALGALGIAGMDAAAALAGAEAAAWEVALRYAERRRFGPFAAGQPDEAMRRRAFAAMMRAGHRLEDVRKIIAASPGVVPVRDE